MRVASKRGAIVCKAYVTKRIKPMMVDGKPTHVIGVPLHWGFTGQALKGYGANTLTPSVGDANTQTPEFKAFLVNVEKSARLRRDGAARVQSAIARLHPAFRFHLDAAVGAQPRSGSRQADRRHALHRLQGLPGRLHGVERPARRGRPVRGKLRQPARPRSAYLDPDAVHRIREPERRPRVADPQGRLHALRGPRLPQGLPGAGRDRPVRQRHRRLHQRELHRLRLLREGLPVRHPAHQRGRPQVVQMHALLRPRRPSVWNPPASRPVRPARSCSARRPT